MFDRVLAAIGRHRMFEPGMRVGVAVSGGADSVCLLNVLRELAPRWKLALGVLHLDHGLRGAESDADAEFVRSLASGFDLPFTLRRAELAGTPHNLEQAARCARLAFFRDQISSGAADRVALGHTRSDQAETVLFRFLRGSGGAGLSGIRPVTSDGIVRPLLDVGREEVEAWLRQRGIPWREDSSNTSLVFARNRIRHQLLPQLARDWNPAISNTLAQAADWYQQEEEYWAVEIDRLATEMLHPAERAVLLDTERLGTLPVAAARRLLRRAVETVRGDLRGIDFSHIEAVRALTASREGHGRVQAPGIDALRSFHWLRIAPPGEYRCEMRDLAVPLTVPGCSTLPGTDDLIHLELIEKAETIEAGDCVYNSGMACVDGDLVSGSLVLRNWRPGDQYQPVTYSAQQKVKDLFQQHRIPLWERRNWPVVTAGGDIVWSRRFGPAARFAAGAASRVLLRIREEREGSGIGMGDANV